MSKVIQIAAAIICRHKWSDWTTSVELDKIIENQWNLASIATTQNVDRYCKSRSCTKCGREQHVVLEL